MTPQGNHRQTKRLASRIRRAYNFLFWYPVFRSFYEDSGYANFGYWKESTRTCVQACDALVDELLNFLPDKTGNILDVACGNGGTTKRLTNTYAPANITAINISPDQVEAAHSNVPDATFLVMDAARMDFDDATFDNIICVEAAFHFNTRQDFLQEAWRVLKPGGYLILSDILNAKSDRLYPIENIITRSEYGKSFVEAGFQVPTIIEARDQTWVPFCRELNKYCQREFNWLRRIPPRILLSRWDKSLINYLLVSARKPDAPGLPATVAATAGQRLG